MNSKDFRKQAWDNLNGKWGNFVLITLVYVLITSLLSSTVFLPFVVAGPFAFGLAYVSLLISRQKEIEIEDLFEGFKNFGTTFVLYIINFALEFLWTLLFIIPGIIKSISYSMSYYILVDNPNLSANEARLESMRLMEGNKWKYFCLQISFIGWILLSILTCGILLLWVIPYMQTASAQFYENLKENYIEITTREEV